MQTAFSDSLLHLYYVIPYLDYVLTTVAGLPMIVEILEMEVDM